MRKILTLLFIVLPVFAFSKLTPFNTSGDPEGKYRAIDKTLHEIWFNNYCDSGESSVIIWETQDYEKYVIASYGFGEASSQLLAIMSEDWDISEVRLSTADIYVKNELKGEVYFTTFYCNDLQFKMNCDEHFHNKRLQKVDDKASNILREQYYDSKYYYN